uniref:Uncharacterized protein n=1 Tax=Globisporangium ultimum (strain ATCC 200006 / CBS 805.95 / DAOM BR144) TaxID=431595 RepID=K3W8K0_GLOUD
MNRVYAEGTRSLWAKVNTSENKRQRAYSANRLFAFADYCTSVSTWRVCLVLVVYCTPALSIMVIFDSVSLQDPRTGWKANVTFWVRFFVGGLFVGGTILLHARLVISELSLTSKQIVVIVLTSALGYTALLMLLAETWMFPVPFTYTIGGMFFMLILSTLVMLTLGRTNQEQLVKIFNFTKSLSVQALMALMYPAYNATFLALDGDGQLAFVLLLPPMKMSLKYLTAKMNPIDDDFMPAMMSSVDIFDAMYMTNGVLHASEAVAMVEYIEAVVPIIYAIYIAILFHLPNARYYQDMAGFTEEKLKVVVMNILAYGVMEMLSLLHVQRRINRQFGVSVFYQLAFALENEWQIYQCCFLSWIIVVFQFLLVHGGVDFSFKFEWINAG